MDFVADLLLAGGAFSAAAFCLVLSRRLKALTALDSGMGAAIAVLSAQVDDLTRALRAAQEAAQGTSGRLMAQTDRAEAACRRLELLVASLHDLPERTEPAPRAAAQGERAQGEGRNASAGAWNTVAPAGRARILRRRGADLGRDTERAA